MAEGIGADVDLAGAPLKYPGLRPWEIWLSEAQERMVVAVARSTWSQLQQLCARHGVEATALGTFTGDGMLARSPRRHDGAAPRYRISCTTAGRNARWRPCCPRRTATTAVAAGMRRCRPQRCWHCFAIRTSPRRQSVIRRYDHEILGSTVVRPLVGRRCDGHADGVVLADPADTHGFAIGIGVNPWFGELDPYRMAHAVVDEAIRNVVAVGADPDKVALLDNFSWGDPRRPSTLGDLVEAVRGCCEASVAHARPSSAARTR